MAGLGAWCFSSVWCCLNCLGLYVFKRLFFLPCACQSRRGIRAHYSSCNGLELCNSLARGMAEVLLRHFSLSMLQLRKQACKFSFTCWKAVVVFFFFSFSIMSDLMGGKHSQIYRRKHILLICILQFSVCRVDSWLAESASVGEPLFGVMLVNNGREFDFRNQSLFPSLVKGKRCSPVFPLPLNF